MNNRDHFTMENPINKHQDNTYSNQQSKQIAMIKWLLTKANKDPESYKMMFQPFPNVVVTGKNFSSHLHPKIVNALQSAELYSAALANIYIDHHFYNPDHNRILQVLARKGVVLGDPHLTVSVLLKCDPINLNAHLSVIEAIMVLHSKEVATSEHIYAAIERFKSLNFPNDSHSNAVILPKCVGEYDQLLLLWINEAISALNKRIKKENNESATSNRGKSQNDHFNLSCKDLNDLTDGIALCALVSFYYPQSLSWKKIRIGKPLNTADCLCNLNLFLSVCQSCFPYQIFHTNPEDVLSNKINFMRPIVIAMLADLFNLLEISPTRCVLPCSHRETNVANSQNDFQRSFSASEQNSCTANYGPKVDRKNCNSVIGVQSNTEYFVVHKGRNIPTLSSFNPDNFLKDKIHEPIAAGKPTSWIDASKNQVSSCGRRSRRNSFTDDSQLTIENFGRSQENINLFGRNPDKESAVLHAVNQLSDNLEESIDGGTPLRSRIAADENRSSVAITSVLYDNSNGNYTSKLYYNNTLESDNIEADFPKDTVKATNPFPETSEMIESCIMSSQMLNIRLKLEEKRRHIELEKRRAELNLKNHRQKLNKAAFLQAISKIENDDINSNCMRNNGGGCDKENNGDGNGKVVDETKNSDDDDINIDHDSIVTYEDIRQVEQRWLRNDGNRVLNGDSSPQFERQLSPNDTDTEKCQRSISEMDSNLHAIQNELQWLNLKENEMMQNNSSVESHPVVGTAYPVSFMLNHENQPTQQNQLINRRLLVSNQQNLINDFYSDSVDYKSTTDGKMNYVGNMNNKFSEIGNYRSPHANMHHHSLISTMPVKTSMMSTNPQMVPVFDNVSCSSDNLYEYQLQDRSSILLHSHTSPDLNHDNYHSMNVWNSRSSVNKENQILVHQPQNGQFYLHRPSDTPPFQFPSPSVSPMNLNYSIPTNATTLNQRKTENNREDTSGVSPQPIPPPRMFTSRHLLNKEQPMTLTRSFTENKAKLAALLPKDTENHISNHNSAIYGSGLNQAEKSYSLTHSVSRASQDLCNLSGTDLTSRRTSVECTSIPSPSVDMAPQCLSFIGTSDESKVSDSNGSKNNFNGNINKLNIVNGSRTYRIPSPTNKMNLRLNSNFPFINDKDDKNEKGFYVSFSNDDDNGTDNNKRFTERIKAPLRMKKTANANIISLFKHSKPKVNNIRNKVEVAKNPETYSNNEKKNISHLKNDSATSEKIIENSLDDTVIIKSKKNGSISNSSVGLLIDADMSSNDPALVDEMERKKERILLQSLQRRQQQEEMKARKEIEIQQRKEQEKQKRELKAQKKEEEKRRRAIILEQHRLKKMIEEAEREGKSIDEKLLSAVKSSNLNDGSNHGHYPLILRSKKQPPHARPRPKTIHVDVRSNLKESGSSNLLASNLNKKGSSVNLAERNNNGYGMSKRDYYRGSQDCLLTAADIGNTAGTSASSIYSGYSCDQYSFSYNSRYITDTDSGLGVTTPPHRTSSPASNNASSGLGSLPPSQHYRRNRYDDTASESGGSECGGLRLYKQPVVKSNRSIMMNAIEYCVFPGEVNQSKKSRLLEEISKSEGTSNKHFLILFRDAGCQYRALYSYFPETEEVTKVSGIGPRLVTEDMFDKFFKYNSGTKRFAQVHTKHLTVTIDAFTIHNNLWQGKKMNLPNKRDMTLVI